jgi:uncharacterized membrane protein YdbT with pleckstrin-like domain
MAYVLHAEGAVTGYVEGILQPNEQVLSVGKMHKVIYLRGLAVVVIGLILLGLIVLFRAWVEKVTTEIAVTNRRVIQKKGLIRRQTGEMKMHKVESVQVEQTILGRLLDYGSISVRGTGSGIEGLHPIAGPLAGRSAIVVR